MNSDTTANTNGAPNLSISQGPKCPDCGRRMGMMSWTGPEPPKCPACSGASVVGPQPLPDRDGDTDRDFGTLLGSSKADIRRLEQKLDRIIELLEDDNE